MTSIPSLLDLIIAGLLGVSLVWFSIDEASRDPNARCVFKFKISKHLRALFYAHCFLTGMLLLFSVYLHYANLNQWFTPRLADLISTTKAGYEMRNFLVLGLVLKVFNLRVENEVN